MNDNLAQYVIASIHNAQDLPTPDSIRTYLIEHLDGMESLTVMHYQMLDVLAEAIDQGRAVDALNIFNLIWWDMNVSSAQRIFRLVQDMEVDPDDDLSGYTAIHLSHTIVSKFHVMT